MRSSVVRATVLSLASMAGSVLFIAISPLFGFIVDTASLSAAFVALGGLFLVAGALLVAAVSRHWQDGRGDGATGPIRI